MLFAFAVLVLAAAAPSAQTAAPTTTLIIVRHAEAMPNAGADPVLSEAGAARAAALAEALKDAGVAVVMTSQYQRTAHTGRPTALAMKVDLVRDAIAGGPAGLDAYVQLVVQAVRSKYAGKTVLIVGHSNTVPALVKAFSGVEMPDLAHDSYDQMFVITTSEQTPARLVRARY
jgi:broad specificity phosphatase PhoE